MATNRPGKYAKIWVDGYKLTTKLNEVTPPHSIYTEVECSGFNQDKSYLAAQADAMAAVNGFFSEATGETHAALKSVASAYDEVAVSVAFGDAASPTIGDYASSMIANQSTYEVVPTKDGLIAASGSFKGRNYPAEFGVLLADLTGATSSSNTTSVDNAGSSSNGGTGFLHLTGVSASDTLAVIIQDSADNSSWSTLLSFTLNGSAIGSERVTVSGTVDRYVRVSYTISGTGPSFDFAVTFHRG